MNTIIVYGASDDLIEIEGVIREEFSLDSDLEYLAFSDGTVLKIRYEDDGYWRIRRVAKGTATYQLVEGSDVDEDYSDRATLTGDIQWVVYGRDCHQAAIRNRDGAA